MASWGSHIEERTYSHRCDRAFYSRWLTGCLSSRILEPRDKLLPVDWNRNQTASLECQHYLRVDPVMAVGHEVHTPWSESEPLCGDNQTMDALMSQIIQRVGAIDALTTPKPP